MSTTILKQSNNMDMECGGFTFVSNFDSSNIDHVELVPLSEKSEKLMQDEEEDDEIPDYEFNVWIKTDCAGTEFENHNKTWFYFGVKGGEPCSIVRLNIVNLNMQGKLFRQGMKPVCKVSLENNRWQRIDDTPRFGIRENLFSIRFDYRPLNDLCDTTYFAFTYPYSYADLQNTLMENENQLRKECYVLNGDEKDNIYYHRECLIKSLDEFPVDLITITSHHGITFDREQRLTGLFPDVDKPRPFVFKGKKVIFLSARVHPGETPSSFVMNGLMKFLLNKTNTAAIALRKLYVFKLIPMLNPDGVSRGYYRTDTRGNNLNRFYCNPSRTLQPAIYAARSLILYYHYGHEVIDFEHLEENLPTIDHGLDNTKSKIRVRNNLNNKNKDGLLRVFTSGLDRLKVKFNKLQPSAAGSSKDSEKEKEMKSDMKETKPNKEVATTRRDKKCDEKIESEEEKTYKLANKKINKKNKTTQLNIKESGLFLYVDFHAHASKEGIFMYGNYFEQTAEKVECLLLPKLLSINNQHFHYDSCNFTKSNMFQRGKRDGLSKEGCGRVAVFKFTGLIKSYTLECNYNTGHFVNVIPPTQRSIRKRSSQMIVPPKYSPQTYEEVGKALCVSILDLTGNNPNSRIVNSQYRSINGLRDHLKSEVTSERNLFKCRFTHRSPNSKRLRKNKMLKMMMKLPRMHKKKFSFSENITPVKKDSISSATSAKDYKLKECSSNTIDDKIDTKSCMSTIVKNRKIKRKLEKSNRENDIIKEKVNESSCKLGKNTVCLKKRMKK